MPLRDHFHKPLADDTPWSVFHGNWATKIVDRLVESALVFRRPDERDRRRVLVFLSDRGRELHRRLAPDVQQAEHELAATLGPDAHHLLVLLHRLAT